MTTLRALAEAFLSRFFDSETASSHDPQVMKTSVFYLIALLAIPGVIAPVFLGLSSFSPNPATWGWSMVARHQGVDVLRSLSRADKTLYLLYAMLTSGILSALAWSSLLLDRRDAFILGAQPIKPARIVAAKLVALLAFVLVTAAAVHALASVSFGVGLAASNTVWFALRGIAAHFIAAIAASAWVCFSIAGGQGLLLAFAGPRVFARLSPLLQAAVTALVVLGR